MTTTTSSYLSTDPFSDLVYSLSTSRAIPTMLYAFLALYFILECAFFFFMRLNVMHLSSKPGQPLKPTLEPSLFIRNIIEQLLTVNSYSGEKFLNGFFWNHGSIKDIKTENVVSFLAWAMYSKYRENLNASERESINSSLDIFCERLNIQLDRGFNPKVKHCNFNLREKIPYLHRPLVVYIGIGLLEKAGSLLYSLSGFQRLELEGVTYWYRPSTFPCSSWNDNNTNNVNNENNSENPALLFFHGICAGWLGYYKLVTALGAGKTILLVDYNMIKVCSMSWGLKTPTPDRYSEIVKNILVRHSISKVSLAGHSFGSITSAWFVKRYPEFVTQLIMIDPVSLLLGFPEVAMNFIYRRPKSVIEYIIYIFASQDFDVSHAMHRHFWWYENILFLEHDLPANVSCVVALSGNDEILNSTSTYEYVLNCKKSNEFENKSPIDVILWPGFSHGQILMTPSEHKSFSHVVRQNNKSI